MGDKRSWWRLAASACVIWILVACGGAPAGPGENTAVELEGTEWRLIEYGPTDAPVAALPGAQVTLKFEDGEQISGSGGCNGYGGTYELDGQTVRMGQIQSTLMACADATVTQQEGAYLAGLQAAARLAIAGDELTLDYEGGKLRFTRMQPAS